MTKKEAKKLGEILLGWASGEDWEYPLGDGIWHNLDNPGFDDNISSCRRKPPQPRIPFTKETAPRHLEIDYHGKFILCTLKDNQGVMFNDISMTWAELVDYNQWDGSSCYTTDEPK